MAPPSARNAPFRRRSGASHPDVEPGERTDGDDGDEDDEHVDGGEHAQHHVARRRDAHGQRHGQADERACHGPALDLLRDGIFVGEKFSSIRNLGIGIGGLGQGVFLNILSGGWIWIALNV